MANTHLYPLRLYLPCGRAEHVKYCTRQLQRFIDKLADLQPGQRVWISYTGRGARPTEEMLERTAQIVYSTIEASLAANPGLANRPETLGFILCRGQAVRLATAFAMLNIRQADISCNVDDTFDLARTDPYSRGLLSLHASTMPLLCRSTPYLNFISSHMVMFGSEVDVSQTLNLITPAGFPDLEEIQLSANRQTGNHHTQLVFYRDLVERFGLSLHGLYLSRSGDLIRYVFRRTGRAFFLEKLPGGTHVLHCAEGPVSACDFEPPAQVFDPFTQWFRFGAHIRPCQECNTYPRPSWGAAGPHTMGDDLILAS